MLDFILMVFFSQRIQAACRKAGVPAGWKVGKLLLYWLIAEVLVMMSAQYAGLNIYLCAIIGMCAGVFIGYLTYRQTVEDIRNMQGNGPEDTP
ncbi:hypothetical protein LJC20_07155 [Eubacteriales bacterium OttesenSCG-928-M02]|nr:hypothetical protein [Eubacteriales bacterium OttesenSCG-928-M02]